MLTSPRLLPFLLSIPLVLPSLTGSISSSARLSLLSSGLALQQPRCAIRGKLKHPRKDGEEAGFPHSKSKKHDRLSFYLANDKFSVHGPTLHVPKLGKLNMTA